MTDAPFSPSWYRVAQLRPRVRGHVRIHRHEYRGEVWYVLQDHAKGRYYRFSPNNYRILGRMDGQRTVHELWESATEALGDDGPTQNEVIQLLAQLHAADVLLCDVTPDTAELLRRAERIERARWVQRLRSPLALRIPLLDPDRFLTRTVGLVRPLFGSLGLVAWLVTVGTGIVLGAVHWPELTRNVVDRVFTLENGVLMLGAYPLVKVLHELGHGYAVKVWGGEVHEMGIILLVFMPVPYVDASAASEFRAKHRRVVVGAAGILVELLLAALALFLWLGLEPGRLRSFAYNIVLIGSVSTVLFNGNPLLRYDGYYVLSDLIEVPNLGPRGLTFLGHWARRYLLGSKEITLPHTAHGERWWLVGYTLAAFLYRCFVYVAILLFIAGRFFGLGLLLAAWVAVSWVAMPLYRGMRRLGASAAARRAGPRAALIAVVGILLLALLLLVVPFPLRTRAQGVVWVPDESLIRARADGFVSRVVAEPDGSVVPGTTLVECRDPLLEARAAVLRARVAELRSRYDAALATDRVLAQIVAQELGDARTELSRAEERIDGLVLRSPVAGRFVLRDPGDLPGRFLQQGDLVAFVLDVRRPTVRVVVPQSDVDLVRQRTRNVEVRLAESLGRVVPATIRREVPGGGEYLPSTILGGGGGGEFAVDPSEASGTKTFERLFQLDLELSQAPERLFIGARAYVRFDHGSEPLGRRLYRGVRQMFLKRFGL